MREGAPNGRLRRVLLVCLVASLSVPAFAQPKVEVVPQAAPAPTVTAIGEAVAQIHPDTAILTFAVEIRNPNTTQAVLVNQRMTKQVVGEIEKNGVATGDIAVDNYRMRHIVNAFLPALGTNQPVEFQLEQHGTYLVTSEIVVTIHHIANVSNVISAALRAGVDRIGRVRYEASSLSKVETGLLPQAIANARQKAESLARVTGLTLAEPLSVVQLPDTSSSVAVVDGNTVSEQRSPPMLRVRLRVRVVYTARKGGG